MRRWTYGLAAVWLSLLLVSQVRTELPATWWFTAADPVVADAPPGVCPAVAWTRDIRRPFSGEWLAVLQLRTAAGDWAYLQRYKGASDYRPDAGLPARLNLAWWFEIDASACHWPPGEYRIVTVWTIHPNNGPARRFRVTSPPFHILEESRT